MRFRGDAERRAAVLIGVGDADEAVDSFDAGCQSADGGIACAIAVEGERPHVLLDEWEDLFENFLLPRESFEEAFGHRHPEDIVAGAADAAVWIGVGCLGFAQIMAEHGEAYHQVLPFVADAVGGKGVEAVAGVDPDIAFRVPLGLLFTAVERFKLREVG